MEKEGINQLSLTLLLRGNLPDQLESFEELVNLMRSVWLIWDFVKAFDKAPHGKVVQKGRFNAICAKLANLIQRCLHNRTQCGDMQLFV